MRSDNTNGNPATSIQLVDLQTSVPEESHLPKAISIVFRNPKPLVLDDRDFMALFQQLSPCFPSLVPIDRILGCLALFVL
jgi:hypothetical protein